MRALFVHGASIVLLLTSCGRSASYTKLPPGADRDDRLAQLRLALAQNPKDVRAHKLLARLQLERGLPGAAIRHFAVAHRNGALGRADKGRLARLYIQRGIERMSIGDAAAHADLSRASRLDSAVTATTAQRAAAHQLAALAALRRADPRARLEVARHLAIVRTLQPKSEALAALAPDRAPLPELAAAIAWAWSGGARRAAHELAKVYVARGGTDATTLTTSLRAGQWWSGRGARPGLLALEAMRRAGAQVCVVAETPEELGCEAVIAKAADDPGADGELLRRARQRYWRSSTPAAAAGWVAMALRAWARGGPPWSRALAARVDLGAVTAQPSAVPVFATATLLRAAGKVQQARAALDRAAAIAGLTPTRRAVVVAEAAAQGRSDALLDRLLAKPTHASGWVAALHHASPRPGRARALLGKAPSVARRIFLRRSLAVAALGQSRTTAELAGLIRARRALSSPRLRAARDRLWAQYRQLGDTSLPQLVVTRLGVPDAHSLGLPTPPSPRALIDIATSYVREPAVADRLARDYVDASAEPGLRAPAVARMFERLGDPARAHQWRARLVAHSPAHGPHLEALAISTAAVGDEPRSTIHAIAASAVSGDPAAPALRIARELTARGHHLLAVGSARRALEHSAPGAEAEVLAVLARIGLAMNRVPAAVAALRRLIDRAPARFRDAARARALRILGDRQPPAALRGPVWPRLPRPGAASDPTDADSAVIIARGLEPRAAIARLRTAIAWSPRHVGARAALLARLPATGDAYRDELAALMVLATQPGPHAAPALAALVRGLRAIGAAPALIAAAEAERRSLKRR